MQEGPDRHQTLISSSLYHLGPVYEILLQSVNNFLSNVAHTQTDKETNATENASWALRLYHYPYSP